MGSDDLFKKRRKERRRRKYETLTPRANSFLIVTEGECTEPMYFKGMKKLIQERIGGRIDVASVPRIDIYGKGMPTSHLIQATERLVKEAKIVYQNVWIVLDRDDFKDFDEAVRAAAEKGFKVAWSNQCFEYWLYLHFSYSEAALYRSQWFKKLDELFSRYSLGDGSYRKNYENIYELVSTYGRVDAAIKNARSRMKGYDSSSCKPSEYDPGTTVHELVEELKRYLEE